MLFQSQAFALLFLPAVLAGFWLLARHETARQWVLVAASLLFYGWWDVRFLPLLIAHAGITWILALLFRRFGRAWIIWFGIVLNLSSLATFKYLTFFVESLEALTGADLPSSEIILPIGISFGRSRLVQSVLIANWRRSLR